MSYIVTGGCGFIGSNFVNYICDTTDKPVFVVDKMTYAANENKIALNHHRSGQVRVYKCDLADGCDVLDNILEHNQVDGIFNFAAESHVDRSIAGPGIFVQSNTVGTFNLLEKCRQYDINRYLQVSTDEVYGSLTEESPSFTENICLDPSSVYSASKASADMLVNAYHKTYGLNAVITRCCNNYGPRAHPEKLIPTVITQALNDQRIPVYGTGSQIREWIHVYDHCTAIKAVFDHGETGHVYNIGSEVELRNIDLVKRILKLLDKPASLIKFVDDRLGHDFRYAIDSSKFQSLVEGKNWSLRYGKQQFNEGLEETIDWYKILSKKA